MWIELFDGKTTKGWKNLDGTEPTKAFKVDDEGNLYRYQGGGDIYYAEQTFADFELEVEWKISPKGNSGIFIRVSNVREVWQTGLEMQVLDDELHPDGRTEITSAGSIYGLVARSKSVVKPVGEWNAVRIVAKDNLVGFHMNGERIAGINLDDHIWQQPVSKFPYAWATLPREGYIVLQDHGDPVWYRNIRVRKL
jgi:hypothetical protein